MREGCVWGSFFRLQALENGLTNGEIGLRVCRIGGYLRGLGKTIREGRIGGCQQRSGAAFCSEVSQIHESFVLFRWVCRCTTSANMDLPKEKNAALLELQSRCESLPLPPPPRTLTGTGSRTISVVSSLYSARCPSAYRVRACVWPPWMTNLKRFPAKRVS